MSKIIFLDIDGVLTSPRLHFAHGDKGILSRFDSAAISFLNRICTEFGITLVISSSWRKFHDSNTFGDLLRASGLFVPIHEDWRTVTHIPGKPLACRGDEIQEWLDRHPEVSTYLILDDDSDMLPHQNFVKTCSENGMQLQHIRAITDFFKDQP